MLIRLIGYGCAMLIRLIGYGCCRVSFCSDFRYESNGIFVLGVGFFFFRQISTFYLAIFDGIFFISFGRYCCPELKFEKIFHL